MGNCLFHAFKGCLKVRGGEDKVSVYFPCRYLRRMIVAWMAHNRYFLFKHKKVSLQSKYGVEGGDYCPEPISVKEYLRKMLKRSFWGEDVVLYALSCLFDLKITVVNGSTLDEHRFRHNQPLAAVDVVLVYNGHNHYIYAGRWTLVHLSGDSVGRCCITGRYYYVLYIYVISWTFLI